MNWNSAPSIRVKNVSGSEIPARSFVKLNGNGGGSHFEHYLEVDKPDGTDGDYYLVTGPHAIANNKIGVAYFPFAPVKVKHSSVPSYVEEVGPASGSWELSPSGSGFVALKQHGDYSFVVARGGASECSCPEVWVFLPLNPTAGTFDVTFTFNGTSDTVTIDWDEEGESGTGFATAWATHSAVSSSDFEVFGGDFPTTAIYVHWKTADSSISGGFPTLDLSSLTGAVTFYKLALNNL